MRESMEAGWASHGEWWKEMDSVWSDCGLSVGMERAVDGIHATEQGHLR